jgi:hypothetical protein
MVGLVSAAFVPSKYFVALPWGSKSTTKERFPSKALAAAKLQVIVDFPTPPF